LKRKPLRTADILGGPLCNGVCASTPTCGLISESVGYGNMYIPDFNQFTNIVSTLSFIQYLYSPNILILVARIIIQSQIINSHITHPGRSLFGLGSMLTFTNMMAAALHSVDFMTGMNGGRGIILDFVGQCQSIHSVASWG